MENKLDLTVIVPITGLDERAEKLLKVALESIKKQTVQPENILLVLPLKEVDTNAWSKVSEIIRKLELNNFTFLGCEEADFCSLVNDGVSKIKTKYFTILEYNSEYTPTYFKLVKEYSESEEYSSMSAFLANTAIVTDKGFMLNFINEAVWGQGFSETMGILDFNTLLKNNNFILGGGVFTKEDFEEVGGFKKDIKIYFAYEFLLRYINNDHNVMVIPKLGYKHMIDENGTIFNAYKDATVGITPEETSFYLDSAKKEYLFNPNEIQREIKYSPVDLA